MARKKKDAQEEFKEEISDTFREMGILAESSVAVAEDEPSEETAPNVSAGEHEHYLQIRDMNRDVLKVYWEWDAAKENAGALKKELDGLRSELTQLISRGPDPQLPLSFGDAVDDSWRSRSIGVLAIGESLTEKLAEGGLSTLGELRVFWDGGGLLSDVVGVGAEYAAKVADAFADYAKEHPEVYGEQTASEETEAAEF